MKLKLFLVSLACLINCTAHAETNGTLGAAKYFETIKHDPEKLFTFLDVMPKGGDLHNHEGGSSMAENMIVYAKNDSWCVDPNQFTLSVATKCTAGNLLITADKFPVLYKGIIAGWSMQDFVPGKISGHDHFFGTFDKFFPAIANHLDQVDTEIIQRAGIQNESYLELMITPDIGNAIALGLKTGWNPNLAQLREQLLNNGLGNFIPDISNQLNTNEKYTKTTLQCGTENAQAGCKVKTRYLYVVLRENPPEAVFAQLLTGFEAASNDARIVGINIAQAEDGLISMRDYKLHMQMIDYLHKLYPNVHISLHAGELVPDLVPPEGIRFHINDAINTGHAERIGHGIDITHEDNYEKLMAQMAKQRIMVEINLTSNQAILNVFGKNHPLPLYISHGVPTSLSTDDEGVDRTNLTREYEKAATTFDFSYLTLKNFARNSITYSFLPGEALWDDPDYLSVNSACANNYIGGDDMTAPCQKFLSSSEKAAQQWDLEKRFITFEKRFAMSKQ